MMIKVIEESDIQGLNSLPPKDWKLDYESFLKRYLGQHYFHAFILVEDGKVVGTGNVFLENKIGWLANIIVRERSRGKGFGVKMTQFLVDFLTQNDCETQLLIATHYGEPIYRKMGFKKITDYQGFQTEKKISYQASKAIKTLTTTDLNSVFELDKETNGEDRSHLLRQYCNTGWGYFNNRNQLIGVYLPDFGKGLVLSRDPKAGLELLNLKHSKEDSITYLPIENQIGIDYLEEMGGRKGMKMSRMILGRAVKWEPKYMYSYGSGYCG